MKPMTNTPKMMVQTQQQSSKKGFRQGDILFDGGSASYVVKDLPAVKCEDKVNKKINQKPIEAAATTKALIDKDQNS